MEISLGAQSVEAANLKDDLEQVTALAGTVEAQVNSLDLTGLSASVEAMENSTNELNNQVASYSAQVASAGDVGGRLSRLEVYDLWHVSAVNKLDLTVTNSALKGFNGGFTSGDYGYLVPYGTSGAYFGKVVRFDLTTFSQVAVLDLTTTDSALKGFHGGFPSGD